MASDNCPRKERFAAFCETTYVPIYSKPWWMDAVCGPESWDVWLFEQGGEVAAAMPYYLEERAHGRYITKAPLTQNNGIVFRHPAGAGPIARAKFEERVVDAACAFVEGMGLAVYEQQFHPSFSNWLPFSWNGYQALPRYTYVIEDTGDLEKVWDGVSAKRRSCIKKGMRNVATYADLPPDAFFAEHEKVFRRQGIECPFPHDLWSKLESACRERGCCESSAALDEDGRAMSLLFLVWDERSAYHLLGGNVPEHQSADTYSALIWRAIRQAHDKGLSYDFEGSMIKRISKSFREFGGDPKLYFRIRKVFDPDVVRDEAESQIVSLASKTI
ncbi:GNAT family N-acetyltransferase [Eggerthella lenta]|uniref:GNAT family N-acetyltransferase n=1 Tax=Eggerthella lenta TaxID=84112 RepID=UPI0022E82496|nr:GNAT family N-acetyltransferase [Eggerthella lenta]